MTLITEAELEIWYSFSAQSQSYYESKSQLTCGSTYSAITCLFIQSQFFKKLFLLLRAL